MSKQTINIGASPNDGTGTPLRTSFDYTNQNFTELYTALGGGVGLPGATTQVIFNDGGTNLAGDAGLVYNKTTDALTVAGLVTAGSATITGDLTVDTSTLKVDSTNNRVGIGTATPGYDFEVAGSVRSTVSIRGNFAGGTDIGHLRFVNSNGSIVGDIFCQNTNGGASDSAYLSFNTTSSGTSAERYRIASDGVATWSNVGGVAGTAMTLNSTGLGIGQIPISNAGIIQVGRANNTGFSDIGTFGYSVGETYQWVIGPSTQANNNGNSKMWRMRVDKPASAASGSSFSIGTWAGYDASVNGNYVPSSGWLDRLIIDSSGNVGIGITPSAWATATTIWRALDLQYSCGIASSGAGSGEIDFLWNAYYDQTDQRWEFKYTGDKASRYAIGGAGVHTWYNTASTGTVNTAITWNPAMTLDASGNLAIGVAATGTRRLEVKSVGTSNTTFAAHLRDSADTLLFHVRSDGYFNTGQGALSPYSNTTGSAANMFVDSSGFVYRSTSSLKYKTDVKDSIHGLADVLKLRSVTYKSKNGDDTVFGGLIAEEVHAAGLTEFVAYAPDKTPDSINYGNMVALLVSAIQELTAEVNALKNA